MSSFGDWFDKELCWISGHSYQIIESSFSQKFYYAGLRDRRKRGSSISQLCSTHHDFVATLYIPGVCAQLSKSGHYTSKQLVVLGTRYGILWPWYGQFVFGLSQPPRFLHGCLMLKISAIFSLYITFTFLFSFHLYTAAIRMNNSAIVMATETAFASLFYGKSHGEYQECENTCHSNVLELSLLWMERALACF